MQLDSNHFAMHTARTVAQSAHHTAAAVRQAHIHLVASTTTRSAAAQGRSSTSASTMDGRAHPGSQPQAAPPPAAGTPRQPSSSSRRVGQGELVQQNLFPSPVPLIDIGVNLVDKSFAGDLPDVRRRAIEANVTGMIVTGTCVKTSTAAAKLCDETHGYPLHFTAGVHPHNAKVCNSGTLAQLRRLASHPRCVAIGECGLDFNRNFSPPAVQEEWFEAQVALAKELRKPLFLHCRDAADKFTEILRRHLPLPAPAVVHCFTGSRQELEAFLAMDMYIGITGWICDDRPERGGAELASLLHLIPRDRLMIETDAPYLTPRTIKPSRSRPGRNEAALLPHVLRAAAASLGVTEEELGRSTTEVARRVFGL